MLGFQTNECVFWQRENYERLTSLALLRLFMFSAMYLTLSMACLTSGDTTEKATTVLMLCGLSCRETFPMSGVSGLSFACWQGQGHFFPVQPSTDESLLSPNSRQFRDPPPTCWRSQTCRFVVKSPFFGNYTYRLCERNLVYCQFLAP